MKKRTLFYILFVLSFCCRMTAASGVYDVRKYGAKGDGRTLDHGAINKAIEAATADGGGQVVLSAGAYLCGSIRLKSNVDLHLMAGAKILAAPASMKAYDDSDRNITISNCTCMWSSGLAFEEVDQGRMENITVSNISLSHVHHYPIYITTGCRNRGPKEVTRMSSARDIYINNVVADDCDSLAGIIITGMEGEPIRNVSLSNIRIQYRGGGKKVTTPYREQGTNYPEPRWAGPTPAYGLFARHVDGLHLQNVKFELMRPDERPDIILEDVTEY